MARILIIDDDHDMVDSLTMILEANGYQVMIKYDISDLISHVTQVNPDLILLDVIFPDDPQAGFKAARLLAKNSQVNHIPVLVLSAVNSRSNLGFSFTNEDISDDFLPVAGFLEKPIEPKALLARVQEALQFPSPQMTLPS